MKITAAVANVSLSLMLGTVPASEKLNELMPFIQASAFIAMGLNNGVQLVRHLKDPEP